MNPCKTIRLRPSANGISHFFEFFGDKTWNPVGDIDERTVTGKSGDTDCILHGHFEIDDIQNRL